MRRFFLVITTTGCFIFNGRENDPMLRSLERPDVLFFRYSVHFRGFKFLQIAGFGLRSLNTSGGLSSSSTVEFDTVDSEEVDCAVRVLLSLNPTGGLSSSGTVMFDSADSDEVDSAVLGFFSLNTIGGLSSSATVMFDSADSDEVDSIG